MAFKDGNLNLFGNKKRDQDLREETERWNRELFAAYPYDTKTNCNTLRSYIIALQEGIDKVTADRAVGVTDTVGARWMSVAGQYRVGLINAYNLSECAKQQTLDDTQVTLDTNLALLDKAGSVSQKTSKTATYVVVGLLAVVIVVASVIFIKSYNKK